MQKKEDSQAGIGSIAEGDHEGEEEEEDEETALEAWQRQQMVSAWVLVFTVLKEMRKKGLL